MNRNFKNIKLIPLEQLDLELDICFTYNIQPNQKVEYTTNKGTRSRRKYSTIPFKAQKAFLTKNIHMIPSPHYYFEQCKDNRYHIHGYVRTSTRKMLEFMQACYEDNNIPIQLQDRLILVEIVGSQPSWVEYCMKHQPTQDVFVGQIEDYINGRLDDNMEKKHPYIQIDMPKYILDSKGNKVLYPFGGKNFSIEI